MDRKTLEETLMTLNTEFRRMNTELERLPRTHGDVFDMLVELANASDDKNSHLVRFPRPSNSNFAASAYKSDVADEETVKKDWHRVLERFDRAVSRLLVYAQVERNRTGETSQDHKVAEFQTV